MEFIAKIKTFWTTLDVPTVALYWLFRWYTSALKLVPRYNSLSESTVLPTSADSSLLRHSVTLAFDDNNNNNNNNNRGVGGGRVMQRCQSEQMDGDRSVNFRSRVVLHV